MGRIRELCTLLLGCVVTVTGCYTIGQVKGPDLSPPPTLLDAPALPTVPASATAPDLPSSPAPQPEDKPLPINLPSALQLAGVRAVDVAAAAERIKVAAAVLEGAQVLWLPSITLGGDYNRHDGRIQDNTTGDLVDNSHSSMMLGAGTGIGPAAILNVGDAIFAPLAARQQLHMREADQQTASNNTLVAVSDAYFNVQQARGELAGALATTSRTEELVRRTRKLAPELVPALEISLCRGRTGPAPASRVRGPRTLADGQCGTRAGPSAGRLRQGRADGAAAAAHRADRSSQAR